MKAIILAAGLGTRLHPLTLKTPKSLLKLNSLTLLKYQTIVLKKCGIRNKDISIVIGKHGKCWSRDKIKIISQIVPKVFVNYNNIQTKHAFSLKIALQNNKPQTILIIDSDVFFDCGLLKKVIRCPYSLIVSKLVPRLGAIGNKIETDKDGFIKFISRNLKLTNSPQPIYAGIASIKKDGFKSFYQELKKNKYSNDELPEIINSLIKLKKYKFFNLTDKNIININTARDLKKSKKFYDKLKKDIKL